MDSHEARDQHEGQHQRDRRDLAAWLRVAALALAGLPVLLTTPLPGGFLAPPVDHTTVAATAVAEARMSTAVHWGEFVTASGLGLLLVGLVFTLPRPYGQRLTPWVALLLALLGLFLGYAALSAGPTPYQLDHLLIPATGYPLAALALWLSARFGARASSAKTGTASANA